MKHSKCSCVKELFKAFFNIFNFESERSQDTCVTDRVKIIL